MEGIKTNSILNTIKIDNICGDNINVGSSEFPLSTRVECIVEPDKIEKYLISKEEAFNVLDDFFG